MPRESAMSACRSRSLSEPSLSGITAPAAIKQCRAVAMSPACKNGPGGKKKDGHKGVKNSCGHYTRACDQNHGRTRRLHTSVSRSQTTAAANSANWATQRRDGPTRVWQLVAQIRGSKSCPPSSWRRSVSITSLAERHGSFPCARTCPKGVEGRGVNETHAQRQCGSVEGRDPFSIPGNASDKTPDKPEPKSTG